MYRLKFCLFLMCWFGVDASAQTVVDRLIESEEYKDQFPDPTQLDAQESLGLELIPLGTQAFGFGASVDISGLSIAKDSLLVLVHPEGTPDQITQLLNDHQLAIDQQVPSIPSANILALRITPETPSFKSALEGIEFPSVTDYVDATFQVIDALEAEPIVRAAAPNTAFVTGSSYVPDQSEQSRYPGSPGIPSSIWSYHLPPSGFMGLLGDHGVRRTRFLAAWNFSDFIRRQDRKQVPVWVIDIGYAHHDDLTFVQLDELFAPLSRFKPRSGVLAVDTNKHGLHVAGIIAADHGNGKGIDGACPHCKVYLGSVIHPMTPNNSNPVQVYFSEMLEYLAAAVIASRDENQDHAPSVVNLSLGFDWKPGVSQRPNDQDKKALASQSNLLEPTLRELMSNGVILISAAGNDSSDILPLKSQWGNLINYTALNSDPPLENVLIVEAVGLDGYRASFSNSPGTVAAPGEWIHSLSPVDHNYISQTDAVTLMRGTSQATPFVTALIAQLYAYNPELKYVDVINCVRESSRPEVEGGPPLIDAFEAMLRAHPNSLIHLADLNGDDIIDQADEDCLIAKQEEYAINPEINYWPREDLNGDGKLSDCRYPVWVPDLGQRKELSDLEVLREARRQFDQHN